MVSLSDTHVQLIEIVRLGHANTLGNLHGGEMMGWLIMAGALTAMRVSKGPIVLGAVDDVAFLTPVKIHEIVLFDAQVEHVGRSSMEVGVQAIAEHPETSERNLTTSCHMSFWLYLTGTKRKQFRRQPSLGARYARIGSLPVT